MNGQNVGYIRVSTCLQNTERQLESIELDEVFTDKTTGKNQDRPQLHACLTYIRKGDVLHVHSIDRLSRNLMDLQDLVTKIQAKGVSLKFHKECLEFSSDPNHFQILMMQMLGAFSEFERNMINERRLEGIVIAKKKGVKFGRPEKLTPALIKEIQELLSRDIAKKEIARRLNISRPLVYRVVNGACAVGS